MHDKDSSIIDNCDARLLLNGRIESLYEGNLPKNSSQDVSTQTNAQRQENTKDATRSC
jgi:hypothetical protein